MRVFFSGIFVMAFVLQSFGWGQTGHRVTGQIAEQHLSKKALKKIENILDGYSIAMVSNLMDEIKSDPKYDSLRPWHYCTIPDDGEYTGPPEEGDVIWAINEHIRILKAGGLTKEREAFVLKCLIHLIGDIHQPLHVGNGKDRGGNDVKVIYFWRSSNLHSIWDSGIIDGQNLSYTEYTNWINKVSKEQIEQWQKDNIMTWANESKSYRPQVYDLPENKKINYHYNYVNIPVVNLRLLQAGIRLAGVLENIYGNRH